MVTTKSSSGSWLFAAAARAASRSLRCSCARASSIELMTIPMKRLKMRNEATRT